MLRKLVLPILLSLVPIAGLPPGANAGHAQPPLQPSMVDYTPIGYYGPADEAGTPAGESPTIPADPSPTALAADPLFVDDPNPSGKWVAYDTNVWESLRLPSRHPGDNCNALAPDDQDPHCRAGDEDTDNDIGGYAGPTGSSSVHGQCPVGDPEFGAFGECFNNQLEWLDHYEASMEAELADFGAVVHRYPFHSPGTGSRGVALDAAGGQAYNISATIPGADHPEETVLVSGHFDFTDSGPAAAWDSAEGHTEVMRIAYIMADYWRKTGTRPSATVKFIPWDSEESGTFGSRDYVNNNIPPGEEEKVRAYFNMDPCAGAYPAFKDGDFSERVPEVMQLANPENFPEPEVRARIEAFNQRAETIVDEVFDRLDDTLTTPTDEVEIFVSDAEAAGGANGGVSQRDEIVTAVGGLALFSSDYANFEAAGIPIFNLFPDYFGPHADGTPGNNEGLSILHTPNDNLTRINRLTSGLNALDAFDPSGLSASEGWAKGQEMCAQIESWYMLQPEMAGSQTANSNPVAYYEALPNEAEQQEDVIFDAGGSYQYLNPGARTLVPESDLEFEWDFGDGTGGMGKVVPHAYDDVGRYTTRLTVRNTNTGATDTMTLPVLVVGPTFPGPILDPVPEEDAKDGTFPLAWTFDGPTEGFQHFRVEESKDFTTVLTEDAEGPIETQWTVTPPTDPQVEPWQRSDSATNKWLGNKRRSGEASFWTGVTPENSNPPPLAEQSVLTTAAPVDVPPSNTVQLQYWSLFKNESDDRGYLEVALEDGDPATDLDWEIIEVLGGPDDVFSPSAPDALLAELEFRRVDLARFAGKQIMLRFRYVAGPTDPVLSHPAGWYIDDIQVQAGTFSTIGTPATEGFTVTGRGNGSYAYQVRAVYTDDVTTAPSNVESVEVTEAPAATEEPTTACPGGEGFQGTVISGTPGDDVLDGTPGPDLLCGLGGNDVIRGMGGDDVLLGGEGRDILVGGEGDDLLSGGDGGDVLRGNDGNDTLRGERGPDRLRGGKGSDLLKGAKGKDSLSGQRGKDTLRGGKGGDRLGGQHGRDTLRGGKGGDRLGGGKGRDDLRGGKGPDRLQGGRGNDLLVGGKGRDRCRDEKGNNTFRRCEI